MSKFYSRWPYLTAIVLALCLIQTKTAWAQPSGGNFALGIQLGQPSGLSLKIYQPGRMSPDILLAWDLNDFFFANVHGIWEKSISNDFNFFYGPGLFLGFREHRNNRVFDDDDEINLGVSGTIGLNCYVDRFEIYLRLTPRLLVIDRTDGDVGGGLGFRFYL